MLQTAQLLPQKGFRRWASTRPVSRPSRQPATGPPGSYPDGTHTRWRRRASVGSGHPINHIVGDALDNAMCESLIGTMKIEKLNRQAWPSVEDVRAAVFEWIETWYNRRRRHSSLGYLSPLEFEANTTTDTQSPTLACPPKRGNSKPRAHGGSPRVTVWLPAQRSQAGLDASLVQLTTGRIDDDAGREPEILRDLMELARQVSDDARIAGQ